MENKEKQTDFLLYESGMARMEKMNHRLIVIIAVLILALFVTNYGWMYYENQFEDTVITQDNTDGINNYIGNDGDITNNGKADD